MPNQILGSTGNLLAHYVGYGTKKGDNMENLLTISKELFELNTILVEMAVCSKKSKTGLVTKKPRNGIYAYIWRWLRFDAGVDDTMPCVCFHDLQNELNSMGIDASVTGIIDQRGDAIMDYLDSIVNIIEKRNGITMSIGAERWRNTIGFPLRYFFHSNGETQ